MPDRTVRLTFPAREPGARKIMADGIQVGHCLANHLYVWRAYLWAEAGHPNMGYRGQVVGLSLAEMRAKVRTWLEATGPWWSDTAATEEAE